MKESRKSNIITHTVIACTCRRAARRWIAERRLYNLPLGECCQCANVANGQFQLPIGETDKLGTGNIGTGNTSTLATFPDIRVIELFAGVGGFRIGLERASGRFETAWDALAIAS